MKRKIIKIDQEQCVGCGKCVNACAEGAIQMVDGKAKLVSDIYCDGLGNCIGDCPVGALTIEEREAEAFDRKAAQQHQSKNRPQAPFGGCPGTMARNFARTTGNAAAEQGEIPSELTQWPIQLKLVPPVSPMWDNADVLLAADCTAFSFGAFHRELLKGKKLVIACPKLDSDYEFQVEKLTQLFSENNVASVTALHMEVPCCTGIVTMAKTAIEQSGKDINFIDITMSLEGKLYK